MSENIKNPKLLGMMGLASRARKIVTGTEIVTEKIKSGRSVEFVIIASDVSQNTLKKVVNCCEYYEVEYGISQFTMDEISNAVGKSCLVSAVAIVDRNFADAIKNLV